MPLLPTDSLRFIPSRFAWCALVGLGLISTSAEAQDLPSPALSTCAVGPDRDGDGLSDQCELELGRTFAPELVVSGRACNWNGGRLEGGYLFGADWTGPEDGVRIVYLPAYQTDCGWSGAKCWVRLAGGCQGHAGDSEFLAVDVRPDTAGWYVEAVFMSAHCFGDDGCRWYRGQELGAMEWAGAPLTSGPVVWVAEGKNANYPSQGACDQGHYYYDTCDENGPRYRFPVRGGRNVGSAASPFGGDGCVTWTQLNRAGPLDAGLDGSGSAGDLGPLETASEAVVECFWGDEPFRGWTAGDEDGVTPYVRYLTDVAEWGPRP